MILPDKGNLKTWWHIKGGFIVFAGEKNDDILTGGQDVVRC